MPPLDLAHLEWLERRVTELRDDLLRVPPLNTVLRPPWPMKALRAWQEDRNRRDTRLLAAEQERDNAASAALPQLLRIARAAARINACLGYPGGQTRLMVLKAHGPEFSAAAEELRAALEGR